MIYRCFSNGCTFDDETGNVFIVCPVCGYDIDGGESKAEPLGPIEPVNVQTENTAILPDPEIIS